MFVPARRRLAQVAASSARRPSLAARTLCIAFVLLALVADFAARPALAQPAARFDLTGPKVEIRVTRGKVTLPIASVPNLQPGDRIWLHPDLPESQSIHYLMVLVFLRGTTNPPPDHWFTRIEAWDKKVRAEGVEVPVPAEAQQAVLFLAPTTGGDFSTLRSAVQGRPGIFVRATQDLNLAGFEQARIEKYIDSMKQLPQDQVSDPKRLQDRSNVIATTLALKPNPDCFKLQPDQQYICLTQSGSQSLLDDGHGQNIVSALSNGPSSDLIAQASYTQLAGAGLYSAYVGAIVDLIRLMGSLHTAQYQYIPAIAFPQEQELNLRLNVAPSFHNPKSVIVIGLPAIQGTTPPPLRPTDPDSVACLIRPSVALHVEGAPLVFSTSFAHNLVLHLNYPDDKVTPDRPQDIPLTADAYRGGLILAPAEKRRSLTPATAGAPPVAMPATMVIPDAPPILTGTIRGSWGFDTFTGPTMPLEAAPGTNWRLTTTGELIAGKDQHVQLAATATACIDSIAVSSGKGDPARAEKQTFQPTPGRPGAVDVELKLSALPARDPDTLHLSIHQFGETHPEIVSLTSYSEPARLTGLVYHAGDSDAMLTGSSLDQVRDLKFKNAVFIPEKTPGPADLDLALPAGSAPPTAQPGEKLTAEVTLKDGRTLPVSVTVASSRPSLRLLNKAAVPPGSSADLVGSGTQQPNPAEGLPIKLGSPDDVPLRDTLVFSLKSAQPFPRDGKIEIATEDGSLRTTLSVAAESLILADPKTLLARLEPLKAFGSSTFGPIRLRAILPDGSTGDWLPLATLVRLPTIAAIACPPAPAPLTSRHRRGAPSKPAADTAATPSTQPVQAASVDSTGASAASVSIGVKPDAATAQTSQAQTAGQPQTELDTLAASNQAQPAVLSTCTLTGANLYLLDSAAPDAAFANPTPVPTGFVSSTLAVPPPSGPAYYLRLHDDPAGTATITLPQP